MDLQNLIRLGSQSLAWRWWQTPAKRSKRSRPTWKRQQICHNLNSFESPKFHHFARLWKDEILHKLHQVVIKIKLNARDICLFYYMIWCILLSIHNINENMSGRATPEPPNQVAKSSRCCAVWYQGKFASQRCRMLCSFSILGGRGSFCSGSSGWAASGFGCQEGLKWLLGLKLWQHTAHGFWISFFGWLCTVLSWPNCSVKMNVDHIA